MSGTSVDGNQDSLLELESERCGTLGEVSHLGRHLLEVTLEVNLVINWSKLEAESIRSDLVRESLFRLVLIILLNEVLASGNLRRDCEYRCT